MADAAAQQEIEIKLKTGEVIKAPTYEEAVKIAVKMAEDTKDVYRQEKEARERLEQQQQQLASQVAQLQRPAQTSSNGFDRQKYFNLFNDDPVMAQNYIDAHRFGLQDPAQVPQYFQQMDNKISVMEQNMLAASFLQQHSDDFPASPESAKALRVQFESLTAAGYPATLDTLNMAYGQAVDNGTITPLEQKEQQREEPNPSLTGGGGRDITEDEATKADRMSDKELEALLKSKGLL